MLAGSPLYVAQNPDEIEILKEEVEEFVSSSLKAIKVSERGVYVQASTLGSLEALLEFLKSSKIPVSNFYYFVSRYNALSLPLHNVHCRSTYHVFSMVAQNTAKGQ